MGAKGYRLCVLLIATLALAGWPGNEHSGNEHSSAGGAPASPVTLADLRTEYRTNPLGLDVARPRLSWQLRSDTRGTAQSAYHLRVATSAAALTRGADLVWESGKVASSASTQRAYAGPPLQSRQRYYWQVRVWNERGLASAWSAPAWWEMGLLAPAEWTAKWIEPAASSAQVPLLRRAFTLRGAVRQARAYVTSLGLYQLFLNGQRVGEAELTPGWTSYHQRLQYQTYDVTELLRPGANAVGALLGEGWYAGVLGAGAWGNRYGERTALLVQVDVTYEDGTSDRIVTDAGWKSRPGPILLSGIYAGETYDARLEQPGWNRSGFDDATWAAVKTTAAPTAVLIAQGGPPVRRIEQLVPKRILRTPAGETVVDLGQNMVGWVRLAVQGPAGTTVTLRHAEVLDAAGNFYTENLRGAQQTVRYTLKGQGAEVYEPHFTFQGFRYVAVEGYPGELRPQHITGIVVHSDLGRTGAFATSNPLLNQLQHNIVWGQKGNFVDIPTDCPQRDERLGWTGDAQVFAPTAAFNADVAGFFAKWLKDLAADQYASGSVPWVVPDMIRRNEGTGVPAWDGKEAGGAVGWGDAATVLPWTLYQAYGDRRVLAEQYESMARWVAYQRRRAGDDLIWRGDFQFGDHADWGSTGLGGSTDTDLIATAYFAHSADLLRRAAEVLGKRNEAARYARLFADVRAAFQRAFVAADARVGPGTQAAYVLALQFGLLPAHQRAAAAQHLVAQVRRQGHLTTGFLGTPGLLFALSEHGYLEDAYRLLLREEIPSWLYSVKRGATTMWERWDGVKPDGSLQHPVWNSFNHYAYGAVGDWMYRVIGGINLDPAAPGYKHILIHPRPGGGLASAQASHITPYGTVSSAWHVEAGTFHLRVQIPPNTTATVRLPSARQREVLEGGKPVAVASGIASVRQGGSDVIVEVGSGQYEFHHPMQMR